MKISRTSPAREVTGSSLFCTASSALAFVFGMLVLTEHSAAQFTFASDSATNSAYSDGWATGDNGGTGFNAWSLTIPGASAGVFTGNPANDGMGTTGIGTTAFGLFSSTNNSGYVNATRSFGSTLSVGDSFSFYWAMNFDGGTAGAKGFDIKSGSTTIFNVNNGGNSTINIGGNATSVASLGYGVTPMLVTLLRTTNGFTFTMTSRTNSSVSYTTNVVTSSNVTGFNLYEGNQSSSAGQRNIYFNNFAVTNSGVFNSGGTLTNGFTFSGSGNLSVGNNTTLVLNGGGDNNFTGTTTISNGSTLSMAGAGNSGFASAISGGGSLSKSGSGTLTLTGANSSFTGKTTVTGGTLSIDSDARLGAAPGSATADQLTLGGGTLATTASFALAANRGITLSDATVSTLLVAAGTSLTNGGVITGTGGIGKNGTGTLTLNGANTHSGQTLLREGVLLLGNDSAFGTGSFMFSFATNTAKTLATVGSTARTITNSILIYNDATLGQTSVNTGSLTFSGPIALGNEANQTRTLLTASGTSHTFSGVVSGLRGIVKQGGGTLSLSGQNTFEGALYLDNGVLNLVGGSLATGAIDLGGGVNGTGLNASNVVLRVSTNGTFIRTITVNAETNGSGVSGARTIEFANSGGAATLSGNVTLEKSFTANVTNSSASGALSGAISGTGDLTKSGNGTLVLSGNNTFSGNTLVSAGTLLVSGGGALNDSGLLEIASGGTLAVRDTDETVGQFTGAGQVNVATGQTFNSRYSGASNTFAGTISGLGGFLKGGTGTLTLSGSNSQTGLTTHEAGVLLVGNNSALGSGIYQVDFNNATNKTIAANGSANFTLAQSNNIYNDLTLGETTGNTGSLTFSGGSFLGNEVAQTRTLTVASGTAHEFSGVITGVRGIVKAGAGTLTLSGNNSYGTTFQLNEGTVLVGNNNAFGSGVLQVQFDVAGTKTIASSTSAAYTIANNVNVFNNLNLGLASGGTGALTFGGTFYLGDEVGQNRVITTASGTGHTVSGAVTGLRGVVKQGEGTLILSGANTSTGGLFIDNGVVNLNGGSLAFSLIDVGSGVDGDQDPNNATLRLTSGTVSQNITVNNEGTAGSRSIEFGNSSGSATFSGTVALEKTATADVANSAATGVLSGVVSGAGGLTKTGSGTLTLSGAGANTYAGLTTISGGTLNLDKSSGNAIAGATTIGSGAVLLLSAGNQVDSGAGDTVTLSGGTIRRGGNVSEVFGDLSLTDTSFLDFGSSNAAGTLGFGSYTPSSLLTVQNFLPGNTLTFGSDLTSTINNGSLFSFSSGFSSNWNSGTSTFTITAIPEPSAWAAAAGLLGLVGASAWRGVRRGRSS